MAETYTSLENPADWRGVPIVVGSLVIYGAPVGRSIAMVEGIVESFTKSGRVNVRIVRRAYGWSDASSKKVVHVGQDRVTVISKLPLSLMATEDEKIAERKREQEIRDREAAAHRATHGLFVKREPVGDDRYSNRSYELQHFGACDRCGVGYFDGGRIDCTGYEKS